MVKPMHSQNIGIVIILYFMSSHFEKNTNFNLLIDGLMDFNILIAAVNAFVDTVNYSKLHGIHSFYRNLELRIFLLVFLMIVIRKEW